MHLQILDMDGATDCINISAFSQEGSSCLDEFQHQLSFQNTLSVIYSEPIVLFRMQEHVLTAMQDISLDYLGKYSVDDPRSQITPTITNSAEEASQIFTLQSTPFNLWSILKVRFFPKGVNLFIFLIASIILFMRNIKRTGFYRELALVGLISSLGSFTSMTVAIFADGKHELGKHLFLSNVLFDIMLIFLTNSVLLFVINFGLSKWRS